MAYSGKKIYVSWSSDKSRLPTVVLMGDKSQLRLSDHGNLE